MTKGKFILRQPNAYDVEEVSTVTGLTCLDESLTVQDHAEDADINTLVKRFGITGEIPVLDRVPIQEDFVKAVDYHTALNAMIEADRAFMELPADLRKRFDHDAGKFVAFCSDEKNRDEMINLGLIEKPVPVAPLEVRVVEPKAEPAA